MSNTDNKSSGGGTLRIDCKDDESRRRWERELDVTEEQLRDAVAKVGDIAADVEMYLKGSRSSTNADTADQGDAGRM